MITEQQVLDEIKSVYGDNKVLEPVDWNALLEQGVTAEWLSQHGYSSRGSEFLNALNNAVGNFTSSVQSGVGGAVVRDTLNQMKSQGKSAAEMRQFLDSAKEHLTDEQYLKIRAEYFG